MHKIQLTLFEKIPYFSKKSKHNNRIGFLPWNYFQLLGILNWTPPFLTSYICQSHNQAFFMTICTYGLAFNLLFDRFICKFVHLPSNFHFIYKTPWNSSYLGSNYLDAYLGFFESHFKSHPDSYLVHHVAELPWFFVPIFD